MSQRSLGKRWLPRQLDSRARSQDAPSCSSRDGPQGSPLHAGKRWKHGYMWETDACGSRVTGDAQIISGGVALGPWT